MIIGGEHFFSPGFLFKKSYGFIDNMIQDFQSDYHINFTFGGYYSILAIIDALKSKNAINFIVLLPSFLCPTILKPFKLKGVQYKFYRVDDELFIDTDHLISIIDDSVKVVFFIDYFGASQLERIQPVINILRLKNISIIQDVVQCLQIRKEQLFGDFIFNSFRKFFPFEGSILLSKDKMNIDFGKSRNKYLKYKRIGQLIRYFHVKYHLFSSRRFLSFLRKADDCYYSNEILMIPKFNRKQLNKFNIKLITNSQKNYYNQLLKKFSDKVPVLLHDNNFIPLGFVIKTEEREAIRKYFFEQNIISPIHWKLSEEIDNNVFRKSIQLSSHILTLPLIGLTQQNFQYLLKTTCDIFQMC